MRFLSITYSQNPTGMPSHYHEGHEILFVTAGKIRVTVEGQEYIAGPGDLVLLSRFEEHAMQVLTPQYQRYALQLGHEPSVYTAEDPVLSSVLVNRGGSFRHVVSTGESFPAFEEIFRQMLRESTHRAPMWESQLALLLQALLILLYRQVPMLFVTDSSRMAAMVNQLRNCMEERFQQKMSLEALAREYHVSASHLAHSFRQITGYAPMEYLTACRLSAAKQYLSTTALPVQEIVDLCGFGDESNFSRLFRRKTGLTPTEFRKKYRL